MKIRFKMFTQKTTRKLTQAKCYGALDIARAARCSEWNHTQTLTRTSAHHTSAVVIAIVYIACIIASI